MTPLRDDPYDILGLAPGASDEDIRSSFRARARKLHPDVNPSPDANREFDRVQRAYRVLIDQEARSQVEAERIRASNSGGIFTWANIASSTDVGSTSDIDDELGSAFDVMFGGG